MTSKPPARAINDDILRATPNGIIHKHVKKTCGVRKPSLRSRILELARQPDSIFLDGVDFYKVLGIDYNRYRGYVKSLRFHPNAKRKVELHHRLPDGKLVEC